MSVIQIKTFNGLIPKDSQRALPPDAATVATNLSPKVSEFRPQLGSTTYAGALTVSNPKTIYRLARDASGALNEDLSTGWKAYSSITQLVKWPQNDNNTERTSVTSGTGAYAPRVIDATGEDRQLGVPVPAKPTLVLVPGTYFTASDRDSAIETAKGQIVQALASGLARAKVGSPYTAQPSGYLEDGAEVSDPVILTRERAYKYSAFEGTITDSYTATAAADVAWVRATGLGWWAQGTGSPAWFTLASWNYILPYTAYGAGYKFTAATASAALTALKLPDGATALLTADQVTELVDKTTAIFDPDGALANPIVQPLRDAVTNIETVLDERPQGSSTAGATTTAQSDAITACANAIYDALSRNAYIVTADSTGT